MFAAFCGFGKCTLSGGGQFGGDIGHSGFLAAKLLLIYGQ
jgi:hypothetical protein